MQRREKNLTDRITVRNSGIELLKIFATILIVISHVMQTLSSENLLVPYHDYVLDLTMATTDIQQLLLSILRYSGVIGNTIFFACSAWFLLENKKFSGKKWFFMLTEVWVISIVILAITYIAHAGAIDTKMIIKSLMPATFATNWYITCYLLFYPIHTILNGVIHRMNQIQLFRSSLALIILYICFDFIKGSLFFPSSLTLWITIYFAVAYMKIYLKDIVSSRKINVMFLCVGIFCHLGIILATNFLGLRIGFFSDKLLYWCNNCNPFIILSIISLLNLVRNARFENKFINRLSGLSMLIYVIHENIILRTYYRPYMVNYVYESFGYGQVLLWMLLLAGLVFILSAVVSFLYTVTVRTFVNKLSIAICDKCRSLWLEFEKFATKIH